MGAKMGKRTLVRCCLTVVLSLASLEALAQTATVRVVTDRAPLWRRNPSVIVATVRAGTMLEVVGRDRQWLVVRVPLDLGGARQPLALIFEGHVTLDSGKLPADGTGLKAESAAATRAVAPSPWESQGFVSLNAMYQTETRDFQDSVTITRFVEQGEVDTSYHIKSGLAWDISGGQVAWKNIGAAFGVSWFARTGEADVTAHIPHPFFFDQPREINGEATGLKHREVAVHFDALVMVPASKRVRLMVFGGPTYFHLKQGVVSDVTYTEAYPYDTAEFTGVTVTEQTESGIGFNVGADVAVLFSPRVGVGGLVRYSQGTIDFLGTDGATTLSVDVGGLQVGGGLRLFF